MAQDFAYIPWAPFKGAPQPRNIGLCTPVTKPSVVTIDIDFQQYVPFDAVRVDLGAQGANLNINKIVSIKVDAATVAETIVVFFPDTGDTVNALPGSVVTTPVMTDYLVFIVYRLVDPLASVLPKPKVRILISNVYIDPSQQLQKNNVVPQGAATSSLYGLNRLPFQAFALGDATDDRNIDLAVVNDTAAVFNLVAQATGVYVVTSIYARVYGHYNIGAMKIGEFVFRDAVGNVYRKYNFGVRSDLRDYGGLIVGQESGLQMYLPAQTTYRIQNNIAISKGAVRFSIEWTYTTEIT